MLLVTVVSGALALWLFLDGGSAAPSTPAPAASSSVSSPAGGKSLPVPYVRPSSSGLPAPAGFKGPTGQPYIQGPSSDPPNY